jgi:LPXTG-motif cell wall-anchored protein
MNRKFAIVCLFFILSVFFVTTTPTYATSFDLIPPTGTLERGQNITFTINIDTEGASVTSIQSGLTYDATLLQYVSVAPGAAMNAVVADTTTYGTGKVLLTGTNTAGYNGTGVFATVVFTIIAQNPGSTEVCTLWLPTPSPTPVPTVPYGTPVPVCGSVCTTNAQCPSDMPCYIVAGQTTGYCRRPACPEISSCVCPVPTALPQTGIEDSRNIGIVAAISFIAAAGGVFYLSQREKYSFPDSHVKKSPLKSKAHKKS